MHVYYRVRVIYIYIFFVCRVQSRDIIETQIKEGEIQGHSLLWTRYIRIYFRRALLQKRPLILRSLLIVANPQSLSLYSLSRVTPSSQSLQPLSSVSLSLLSLSLVSLSQVSLSLLSLSLVSLSQVSLSLLSLSLVFHPQVSLSLLTLSLVSLSPVSLSIVSLSLSGVVFSYYIRQTRYIHIYDRVRVIYSRVQSLVETYPRYRDKEGRVLMEQLFPAIYVIEQIYVYLLQGACYILFHRLDICMYITGCVLYIFGCRVQSRDTQERETRVRVWWSRESEFGIYIYICVYIFFFVYIYIYLQSLVDYS